MGGLLFEKSGNDARTRQPEDLVIRIATNLPDSMLADFDTGPNPFFRTIVTVQGNPYFAIDSAS